MRFSILQMCFVAAAAAALVTLLFQSAESKIVWRSQPLHYQLPTVPESYQSEVKPGTTALMPEILFVEGRDLFEQLHFAGWKACRYHFYSGFDIADEGYRLSRGVNEIDLKRDSVSTAATVAYALGYNLCKRDIENLSQQHSVDELRQKLAIPKPDNRIPAVVLLVISLFGFVVVRISNKTQRQLNV